MTRPEILDTARHIVTGDRETQYGPPEDTFAVIAGLWTAYTGHEYSAHDVAMMLALLKVGRIARGQAWEDNYVDACGYLACAGELRTEEG